MNYTGLSSFKTTTLQSIQLDLPNFDLRIIWCWSRTHSVLLGPQVRWLQYHWVIVIWFWEQSSLSISSKVISTGTFTISSWGRTDMLLTIALHWFGWNTMTSWKVLEVFINLVSDNVCNVKYIPKYGTSSSTAFRCHHFSWYHISHKISKENLLKFALNLFV